MMKNISFFGIILTLCAAFLWGTAGTAQNFARGGASPYWIGAFRLCVACIFFYGLSTCYRSKNTQSMIFPAVYWVCIVTAGICIGLYNLTFFAGIKATGIAIGTATTIGSAPIWAGLMQSLVLRQMPPRIWWLGTGCATVGGTLMVVSQTSSWNINPAGLLICLSAGFCYALYTLMSKRVVSIAPSLTITKHIFSVAIFIAVPIAWYLAGIPTVTIDSVLVILYLGFFTTGIAYLLYTHALNYISAATGVALALTEPIVAFILAITLAGESVNLWAIIGLILILVGLGCVLNAERQQ